MAHDVLAAFEIGFTVTLRGRKKRHTIMPVLAESERGADPFHR
jgi:hypothetical protein